MIGREHYNQNCVLRPRKKKPFYGRTDLPSRFGRSGLLTKNICYLSGGKSDSPKNKKKISKKSDVFWKEILEKYSQLLSKIFSQIFLDFGQKWLILHDFSKLKKTNKQTNKTKNKNKKRTS